MYKFTLYEQHKVNRINFVMRWVIECDFLGMKPISDYVFKIFAWFIAQCSIKGNVNKIIVSDIVCVVIFSLEYLIRFFCSPQKWNFFREPMNLGRQKEQQIKLLLKTFSFLVDFFALLPFYVSLVLEELEDYQIIGKAGKIVRLMRVRYERVFEKKIF